MAIVGMVLVLASIVAGLAGACSVAALSVGTSSSVVLLADGRVMVTGQAAQLGIGDAVGNVEKPVVMSDILMNATDVGSSFETSVVVRFDGRVLTTGLNVCAAPSDVPVVVPGLSGIVEAKGGEGFLAALDFNGDLYTWGFNRDGELGDGTTIDNCVPTKVVLPGPVSDFAVGNWHMLAVINGDLWGWGANWLGQLGNGMSGNALTPIRAAGAMTGVLGIAAGREHSLAFKSDGTAWSWGANFNNELGIGTAPMAGYNPAEIVSLTDPGNFVIQAAAGANHSMVLKMDATVWSWGYSNYGQRGDGITTEASVPVQSTIVGVVLIEASAHGDHSLALTNTAVVLGWGRNSGYELGDGTNIDRSIPVPMLIDNLPDDQGNVLRVLKFVWFQVNVRPFPVTLYFDGARAAGWRVYTDGIQVFPDAETREYMPGGGLVGPYHTYNIRGLSCSGRLGP